MTALSPLPHGGHARRAGAMTVTRGGGQALARVGEFSEIVAGGPRSGSPVAAGGVPLPSLHAKGRRALRARTAYRAALSATGMEGSRPPRRTGADAESRTARPAILAGSPKGNQYEPEMMISPPFRVARAYQV